MKTKKIKTLYLTNFIFRDIFLLDYRAAEEFSLQFKLKTIQYDLNITRIANVHYFEFISNYHTESDYHPFHELGYVDRGEMHVKAENYQGVLRAQQFILHLPNEKHMLSCDLGSARPPDARVSPSKIAMHGAIRAHQSREPAKGQA